MQHYLYCYSIALYNNLKVPTGRRQTRWLFTQHSQGVELRATKNISSEWQGEGLETGTNKLQVWGPNHSATPPKMFNSQMVVKNFPFAKYNIPIRIRIKYNMVWIEQEIKFSLCDCYRLGIFQGKKFTRAGMKLVNLQ